MNIHFILHETFEVPGAYLKWAQDRGHQISSTKVYEEAPLPDTVDGIDFLIVMGGPQSPDEDRQAFPYYDPKAEIAFIQKAIAADIYIVGVCLGAQLLSVASRRAYQRFRRNSQYWTLAWRYAWFNRQGSCSSDQSGMSTSNHSL